MPSRVAFVLGTASGGTARHAAMLAHGCAQDGLVVSVFGPEGARPLFCPGQSAGPGAPAGDVIAFEPVAICDRPSLVRDMAALLRLRRLLARVRPDVVHAHGLRAGSFAVLALAWRPGHRPALLVTVHNAAPAGRGAGLVYRILEGISARHADVVLCVSADLAARMRRLGARETGLAVVPAPPAQTPSPAAVRKARSDLDAGGRPVVLAVGRLAEQKGYAVLLDAAASWQHRHPEPLLVIAGEGPLAAELQRGAQERGVAARFLGQRADVPALLAAADVFVLASSWEGQSLAVQEALQAGRPIVASRVGGTAELTGEDGALLVPPGDPLRLAAAVLSVLDDPVLAARLAAAARTRAATLPSPTQAVAAATALYDRLAADDRVRSRRPRK